MIATRQHRAPSIPRFVRNGWVRTRLVRAESEPLAPPQVVRAESEQLAPPQVVRAKSGHPPTIYKLVNNPTKSLHGICMGLTVLLHEPRILLM